MAMIGYCNGNGALWNDGTSVRKDTKPLSLTYEQEFNPPQLNQILKATLTKIEE